MIGQVLLIQTSRIAVYLMVVFITLVYYFLQDGINWELLKSFYLISALGLFMHSLSLFSLDKYFQRKQLLFSSFVIDIFLISALYLYSGLNSALFLFMYLIMIILGGLVFRLKGALALAALCSIGFTLSSFLGVEVKAITFIFLLVLNNLAFFAVAFLSGYLSEQLNLFAGQLQVQNLTVAKLKEINSLMIENFPSGLLTVGHDGEVLHFNPAAKNYFPQLERGSPLFEQWPTLKPLKDGFQTEMRLSDSLFKVQVIQQGPQADSYLVWVEDLTESRKKELALRQTEKMAAIGQLSAGIAHEIRNPLASISGSIELLSQNFSEGDDKKLTKIILKEIDRLNNLITEFLDFAKPEKAPTDTVKLFALLKEVSEGQKSVYPKVQMQFSFSGEDEALGHADKLKQAFLNLVVNACQAMNDVSAPQLSIDGKCETEQIIIRIKDNGVGMSEDTVKRIFEPFFTTKTKGTGLGLALTHKILTSQGVQIFVDSQQGLGTEFRLIWNRNIR